MDPISMFVLSSLTSSWTKFAIGGVLLWIIRAAITARGALPKPEYTGHLLHNSNALGHAWDAWLAEALRALHRTRDPMTAFFMRRRIAAEMDETQSLIAYAKARLTAHAAAFAEPEHHARKEHKEKAIAAPPVPKKLPPAQE